MRWGENMQAVGGWVFQKIPHFEPKYARIAKVQVVMHANIEQCCCGIISNSGLVHVSKILTGLGTFCSLDKWNATMDHFESRWNSSKNWTRPLQRLHPSMQALSTSPRSWLGLEPSAAWTSEMRNNYGCSRTLNTVWYGVATCECFSWPVQEEANMITGNGMHSVLVVSCKLLPGFVGCLRKWSFCKYRLM